MRAKDLEARAREALGLAVEHARDTRVAADFADDAVRLAEEVDDPALLATALDARLTTHAGPDDLDARLGTSLRLLALVRQEPDPDVRLAAHVWRLTTALEQLDLSTVRRQLAALDLLADETHEGRARFFAASRRAMFALTEGDSVGAARLASEAADAGADVPDSEAVLDSLQVELARHRADRGALSRHAQALEDRGRSTHLPTPTAEAAVLWIESGEPERARRLVDLHAPDLDDLPRDGEWLVTVSKLCEAAAGSGRPRTAAECARLLEPYAGRAVLKPLGHVFSVVVDDYLALATGDPDRADEARAAYRRLGADWWVSRGPLGRPNGSSRIDIPRVLHLHPTEAEGSTRLWSVGHEGSLRVVPSMHGLEYIRLLLESPRADVPALELAARADPGVVDSGTGTLVDQEALAEHRRRSLESPDAPPDREGAEPARAAVRKAIRAALARLELHDGEIAYALRTTIRIGAACRYEPDPFRPVVWRTDRAHAPTQPTLGS